MALQVIDLLLHFGISDLAGFLLEGAVQVGSQMAGSGTECALREVI